MRDQFQPTEYAVKAAIAQIEWQEQQHRIDDAKLAALRNLYREKPGFWLTKREALITVGVAFVSFLGVAYVAWKILTVAVDALMQAMGQ